MDKETIKTLLYSVSNMILFFSGLVFYKLPKIERWMIIFALGVNIILIILCLLLLILQVISKLIFK